MKKILTLLSLSAALALTGVRCTRAPDPELAEALKPITLQWWRTVDDEATLRPLIEAYRIKHPQVQIQVKKWRPEEYDRALLEALAEDRSPDLISLPATWLPRFRQRLAPLPSTLTIPVQKVTRQGFGQSVQATLQKIPSLTARQLKEDFLDVVAQDVLWKSAAPGKGLATEEIYGLPLYVDTLGLYYNRELLNLAGLPKPPQTWEEFQTAVKKLTLLNEKGEILRSGAALGNSRNVTHAADLLAVLMLQNGATMLTDGQAVFDRIPAALQGVQVAPGEQALNFYTEFANPSSAVYTWNEEQTADRLSFAFNKTAMLFGYAGDAPLISARAPRVRIGLAPLPQIEGNRPVNLARYVVETVPRKSQHPAWAWDFLQFAASPENVKLYLNAAKKPPALRALITEYQNDELLSPFVGQLLTAQTWYRGAAPEVAEESLGEAIVSVNHGTVKSSGEALKIAAQKITQTLR